MTRYMRQMQLPEIGVDGQTRLAEACVLVIGAGGLGCPVLSTLVGAGVGKIMIVDHDKIEESNLHRQPLYRMNDIGRYKAEAAREALLSYNPDISIEAHVEKLGPENVTRFIEKANLVVDAADNFAVTYTLSDACAVVRKPLVSASVLGFSGYAGLFCGAGPSYRAVFPDMPEQATNCAEAGVLGSAVALIGALQAHLVLHALLQLNDVQPKLITFDGKTIDFGGFDFSAAQEPLKKFPFIAPADIRADDIVVDLRGLQEAPVSPVKTALRILPENIESAADQFQAAPRTVLCCRSGLRSAHAAQKLDALGIKNLVLVAFGDALPWFHHDSV
ncbi:MAG: HesA/MoeB/ThiF family protein [Pseudomonadota bacterium]